MFNLNGNQGLPNTGQIGAHGGQPGQLDPKAAMALIGAALIAHAQTGQQGAQGAPGGFRADGIPPQQGPHMPQMGGRPNMGFHPRDFQGGHMQFPPRPPMPGAFQFQPRPGGGITG